MPTARAPRSLAIWPTIDPTGPLAAATATVFPGFGWPMLSRPQYAVMPGMPSTPSAVDDGSGPGSIRRSPEASTAA